MASSSNWYLEVDASEKISQGDIFLNCPIYKLEPGDLSSIGYDLEKLKSVGDEERDINWYYADLVVMTQACDLENNPVENIVLCDLIDINDNIGHKTYNQKKDFIGKVHAGRMPGYSLIENYTGANVNLHMDYKIVDFAEITTLSYVYLEKFLEYHKEGKRLRLNTPHRELLSQKFGNYFARIGLPNEDFIKSADAMAAINKEMFEQKS